MNRDRIAAYDANGAPLLASHVLSDDEYGEWLLGLPVRREQPVDRVERAALVAELVRLQGGAS